MGSANSSKINLPTFNKDRWQQIPPLKNPPSRSSFGIIKIFRNTLTNQQVQQYSLIFESNDEFEQYLQSFQCRINDQNFVNTRYIDVQKDRKWCGFKTIVKVYIQRIPLRLSSIKNIPQPQNLYVLLATLQGVQRLYRLIGFFNIDQEMIGVDREGRIKVWLNINFSKNYLYGPNYIDGIIDPLLGVPQDQSEQVMVCNIVNMIQANTSQQIVSPLRISQYLRDQLGNLSFTSAIDRIKKYAKKLNIKIPKYFQSIRNILNQQNNQYDLESKDFSSDFNLPSNNKKETFEYIDSSNILSSKNVSRVKIKLPSSHESISLKKNYQTPTQLPLSLVYQQGVATGESTVIKNQNFSRVKSRNTLNNNSQVYEEVLLTNLPKIMFNYSSMPASKNQNKALDSPQKQQSLTIKRKFEAQTSKQEHVLQPNRLIYSDIKKQYALDDQLFLDLLRFRQH